MVIDPTNYTIAVSQAEAAVQQAQASVQNIDAHITVRHAQISASQAQLELDLTFHCRSQRAAANACKSDKPAALLRDHGCVASSRGAKRRPSLTHAAALDCVAATPSQ
jgi:multidrug resistance efflux pump